MAKSKKQLRADYCRNWPYGTPAVKRAPFSTTCADSDRKIERGELCAVFRGYWYKLDSASGRKYAAEADEVVLDYFA